MLSNKQSLVLTGIMGAGLFIFGILGILGNFVVLTLLTLVFLVIIINLVYVAVKPKKQNEAQDDLK